MASGYNMHHKKSTYILGAFFITIVCIIQRNILSLHQKSRIIGRAR